VPPRSLSPLQPAGSIPRAEYRQAKQLDVAEDAVITVSHLSKIETGKVNPTWGTVESIAAALGVTIADLARRSGAR
jgi:transcriptional regulator with XRE-family HTH domain